MCAHVRMYLCVRDDNIVVEIARAHVARRRLGSCAPQPFPRESARHTYFLTLTNSHCIARVRRGPPEPTVTFIYQEHVEEFE